MRMVIDDVGRPLTEFRSTYELFCALRDAIQGKLHVVVVGESLLITFQVTSKHGRRRV